MKKTLTSLFFLFIFCGYACANTFDQIDKTETQCIKKTSSTAKMLECTAAANAQWKKETENYYNKLINSLDPNAAKALEISQKSWEKYKNDEINFINQMLETQEGTMLRNVSGGYQRELTKQRAIQLKNYYKAITR